jgi:4-hydroxybenzoyl-CoA thioesterase
MFTTTQRIRVEWAHCDAAGIIFNPHYYIWMNGGTHALIQASGFDFIGESQSDSSFQSCPLVASNMAFRTPLYFGDVVTLHSRVEKFGNTSFVVAHDFLTDEDSAPVAQGSEVRVWALADPNNPKAMVAHPVPEEVRTMLSVPSAIDVSV